MGWLDSYKNKFDEEAAKKEKEDKERQEMWARHRKDAEAKLNEFIDYSLKDLVGRKTKDGKTLKLGKEEGHSAIVVLWADDEKLLSINYYYQEGQEYDGDGMSWGSGNYYIVKNMYLYRPHTSKYGYKQEKGRSSGLDEEELAHYLLTILE